MSSLSLSRLPRPYQFLLLAVVLAALLWVAVLNSLLNSSSSSPEASVATHPTLVLHRHAPLVVHHASPVVTAPAHAKTAPSVAVRSRHHSAVSGHHHAVLAPHRTVVHRSSHRGATAPATHHPAATHVAHRTVTAAPAHRPVHRSPAPAAARPTTHAAPTSPSHHAAATTKPATAAPRPVAPAPTRAVNVSGEIESQLGAGKLVLVLFWEPKAAVDQYVRKQVSSAVGVFGHRVAVHYVLPAQVGELGTWTDKVLVAETPTLLMITPARQVSAFAGFSDEASITQNIDRLLGLPHTPTVKKAAAHKSAGKAKKSGHSARRGH